MSTPVISRTTASRASPFLLAAARRHATTTPTFADVLVEHAAIAAQKPVTDKHRDPGRQLLPLADFFGERVVGDYRDRDSLSFLLWYRRHRKAEGMRLPAPREYPATAAIDMLRLLRRATLQYGRRHRIRPPKIAISETRVPGTGQNP